MCRRMCWMGGRDLTLRFLRRGIGRDRSPGPTNELQAAIEALPANLRSAAAVFAAFGRDSPEQDEGHPDRFFHAGTDGSAATCGPDRSRGITRSMMTGLP